MFQVYLNYPNSKISIHGDCSCRNIMQMRKIGQRLVSITRESLSIELMRFETEHKFAAEAANNDMWITVDIDDRTFEMCVISYIKKILDLRYKRFRNADVEEHC